ncbi:MAG: NYN domain-containing protein [Myxococcota bacterium]|nr:NYN domain-containing protein [Myxococcota bacterium]
MKEENLCVLIDFENIAAGTEKEGLGRFKIRLVMNRLKEKGRILVTRAYGDWGRFAHFKQSLLEQGVSMMELTSYRGQDKNRADIALVVDAMELAYTRDYINTYVLMSGDSDFTPLVMRLKELNKRVIGLGTRGSTSRLLAESCDEFIFYENILKREKKEPPSSKIEEKTTLPEKDAFALLKESLEGLLKDQPEPVAAGRVKQSMLRKVPTFDESEYAYSGFTDFLKAAQTKKIVSLHRDDQAGGYRVEIYTENEADIQDVLPPISPQAEVLRNKLIQLGTNPTSHMIRHTVVHELVDQVSERMARKKRNSLKYVYSDIQRRCRKTDPPISAASVRHVINALKESGILLHTDGDPIRSDNAAFIIVQDAESILIHLREFFLQRLLSSGEALQDPEALSMLLWEDTNHAEEIEEIIDWLQFEDGAAERSESKRPPAKKTIRRRKRTSGSSKSTPNPNAG